jgi:hypothetical protein
MSNPAPHLSFFKNNILSLKKYEVSSHQLRTENYSIKRYGLTKTQWKFAVKQGRKFAGSFIKQAQRQKLANIYSRKKPIPFDRGVRQPGDFYCPFIAPGSFRTLTISQQKPEQKEHLMDRKYEESLMVKEIGCGDTVRKNVISDMK